MSLHYIELALTVTALLGTGEVIYKGKETTTVGNQVVDNRTSRFNSYSI